MGRWVLLGMAGLILAAATVMASAQVVPIAPADRQALDAALGDVCSKRIAMLGETTHGDGHSDAFKVALVEQLIRRCGFSALYFEASVYEFVAVNRAARMGAGPADDDVAAAIGGLWKFDREFQPLIPFIAERVRSGELTLDGVDGQLGGLGQSYANDQMPDELCAYVDEVDRAPCVRAFGAKIYGRPDGMAYDVADQQELLGWVGKIRSGLMALNGIDADLRHQQMHMLGNVDRFVRLSFASASELSKVRDRAMFLNFRWAARRLPRGAKIILWSATAHIAHDARVFPPFAGIRNLGNYMRHAYGREAFALSVSAHSGSYRWDRTTSKYLPPAPTGSLQAQAMANSDAGAVYLDRSALVAIGKAPGAIFAHDYLIADWSRLLDGAVVLREEHRPHSTRPGYQ